MIFRIRRGGAGGKLAGFVTGLGNGGEHGGYIFGFGRMPMDAGTGLQQADCGALHPGDALDGFRDVARTIVAGHAADVQFRVGGIFCGGGAYC